VKLFCWLGCILGVSLGLRANECRECAGCAEPVQIALDQSGPRLIPGENDQEWLPLLQTLAAKNAVFATFNEQRWFSFRRKPVVLAGEMRMEPTRGLSLRYLKPDEKMMIVDSRGIVLRNARGRSRGVKSDPRSPNTGEALLRVMRFDLENLVTDFDMHAVRSGERWRFDFVPRVEQFAASVGPITVWGEESEVTRLEMKPTKGPRIEITITSASDQVVFTKEEVSKYFR